MVLLVLALVVLVVEVVVLAVQTVKISHLAKALALAALMVAVQVAHGLVLVALPHLARLVLSASSGPARLVHSHQLVQETYK